MDVNPPVSQSEDAAMQRQQLSAAHPGFYLPPSQTQGEQLPPSNDTVLSLGQLLYCDRRLKSRCNVFSMRCADNALHRGLRVGALAGCHALSE
jgi:hypothetical protein